MIYSISSRCLFNQSETASVVYREEYHYSEKYEYGNE
jgi:hypothetical protein